MIIHLSPWSTMDTYRGWVGVGGTPRYLHCVFVTFCSKLDQNSKLLYWNNDEVTVRTCSEGLRDVQLLELDVSVLGFPLPFFGGLGVLRCLDDVPRGVLLVRSAAAPRVGSEGTGSSTWYCLAI